MKKSTIILVLCIINYNISSGQNLCGSDSLEQILLNIDPVAKMKLQHFQSYAKKHFAPQHKEKFSGTLIRYVPVVFHIIHDNGPENIPDSVIDEQIDILNESFRKLPGTPGDGAGVDTKIEFCLATIDTAGNPTTGITRTVSPCTDINAPGCSGTLWPGNIIFWYDSNSVYLNIWIRRNFGYSGLGGPGFNAQVRYDFVGRNGLYGGRVLVHEIGHWLGLPHTFDGGCGNDCSNSGDYICDTPPAASPNSGCPVGVNSCHNDNPDLPDQIENYMDYSLNCANMFTQGQKEWMYKLLDNPNSYHFYMTSYENLINTGCNPCPTTCTPIAEFKTDKRIVSVGEGINFTDISYFIPTSWLWNFPGGNPSSSTTQNPVVTYDSVGSYDVILIATNAGGSDTIVKNDYINIITQKWSSLGAGLNDNVQVLEVFQNELYAGGNFLASNADSMMNIARWNGADWLAVGTGQMEDSINGWEGDVWNMEVYNNELYIAGQFTSIGGVSAVNIAKWNGSNWSSVGSGFFNDSAIVGEGASIIVFNNELYVSYYDFNSIRIIKYNGTSWSQVATANGDILVFSKYNNELYAGGSFDTINGMKAKGIARFDGTNWYAPGLGLDGGSSFGCTCVYGLIVYDSTLYVGGDFTTAGGLTAYNNAWWNGTNWYAADSGFGVWALETLNNELYGAYIYGTQYTLAKWNEVSWMPLGTTNKSIHALKAWNNEIYAGGGFTLAGGDTVNHIAKWGCPNLYVAFTQSADTVDLAVSGNILFYNQSANATKWFWDFGDGATDTIQNPVHTYWDAGAYIVKLTASNDTCSNSLTSTVVVQQNCFPLANVNFGKSTDTLDLALTGSVSFYVNPEILADSIIWDFGDGITDTAQNPVHTYDNTGVYSVTLTGYKDSCQATASSNIVVVNTTGISELKERSLKFKVYPNPFSGSATIEVYGLREEGISIIIYDITSRILKTYSVNKGNNKIIVSAEETGAGIFFVQLIVEGKTLITKKIVVMKHP